MKEARLALEAVRSVAVVTRWAGAATRSTLGLGDKEKLFCGIIQKKKHLRIARSFKFN